MSQQKMSELCADGALASIIIRTYNEERHLEELLAAIVGQSRSFCDIETIIVDSGSTDRTLDIAEKFGCRITEIKKEDFTFGRSLNIGCDFSAGEFLVFVSGHCVPVDQHWVSNLVRPLADGAAAYSYGRQIGRDTTKFSEKQVFRKYFPERSSLSQEGYFCNNANAALRKDVWSRHAFDETLTGLEDMDLAKRLVAEGMAIAYMAEASIYHIHDEGWAQVRHRYEREAIALQKIMPEVQMSLLSFARFFLAGVLNDIVAARKEGSFLENWYEVVLFRANQYWGAYRGSHVHRKLSREMRERYYYPSN